MTSVKVSRDPKAVALVEELKGHYEGGFFAAAITCGHCRKVTHTALPDDYEGCGQWCDHCERYFFVG